MIRDNLNPKFLKTFKMDYYNTEGLPRPLTPFDPVFRFAASKLRLTGLHKYLHYSKWLRNELAEYVKQKLSEAQARQNRFFNPTFLRQLAEQHASGKKNFAPEINVVLTLESVARQLFRELPRGLEN